MLIIQKSCGGNEFSCDACKSLYLCIYVSVYLCICVFVYLCIWLKQESVDLIDISLSMHEIHVSKFAVFRHGLRIAIHYSNHILSSDRRLSLL